MTDDDIIAASRAAFLEEARDMLAQLESSLLALGCSAGSDADDDSEALNAAFRAAHTIKGSSGLFGYSAVVAFTHEAESVLDALRDGRLACSESLVSLLLAARDQIAQLVEAIGEPAVPAEIAAASDRLVVQLRESMIAAGLVVSAEPTDALPAQTPMPATEVPAGTDGCWHISLRFKADALRNGLDPLSFLRYLPTVGDITSLATLTERVPALEQLDPEGCHLGFEIRLRSAADKSAIEKVFEFALDDCELRIVPPAARTAEYLALIEAAGDSGARLGEILVGAGVITERERAQALALQADGAQAAPSAPMGQVLQQIGAAAPPLVEAALQRQQTARQAARDRSAEDTRYLRVPADKLDRLIDLIGELVIAGSGARLVAAQEHSGRFSEAAARICSLVEAARDGALQLRMVQIGETFNRFRRVVRDVSATLGKTIELQVAGGETELDKSMVEQITDPLMHLVRNSLDHGIEPPQARLAAGKPAQGRISLNAYHDSGSIVIEVSDDGRGLDRDRIVAKALQRGLVKEGQTLSDDEVWQLIFLPGFSTAEQVTDISGRGVGMDVVKRNIEALRGQIQVSSRAGRGTTLQIRLPLTLAIIDGFLVAVGGAHYIVPLELVVECIETPQEALAGLLEADAPPAGVFNLRGEVMPYLVLRRQFGIDGTPATRQSVVVVQYGPSKIGLVVDRLLGEYQTVIKPLGRLFQALKGIAGSTILGSGEVALILDIPALVATVPGARGPRSTSPALAAERARALEPGVASAS